MTKQQHLEALSNWKQAYKLNIQETRTNKRLLKDAQRSFSELYTEHPPRRDSSWSDELGASYRIMTQYQRKRLQLRAEATRLLEQRAGLKQVALDYFAAKREEA